MILINIKMSIRPDKMDEWLALADSYSKDVNSEEGCLFFQFARSLTDDSAFVCIEGFTDAEAGARDFPDSTARSYNYFVPQKRKQTHYEDVTVEVQPDPRHYLAQGWIYGFADGKGGYALRLYWNPLVPWIWLGAALMAFGGLVSLTDRRHRVGAPARRARPIPDATVQAAE